MMKVCSTASVTVVVTAKGLRPYVLSVPAVPLALVRGVAGVKKEHLLFARSIALTIALFTVTSVSKGMALVISSLIGVSVGHKSTKRSKQSARGKIVELVVRIGVGVLIVCAGAVKRGADLVSRTRISFL